MLHNHHDMGRYRDDLERERLIYSNGEYFRVREAWFTGGPFGIPRYWHPPFTTFRPFWMAGPRRVHPLHYWTDLDYRYQGRMKEELVRYFKHYENDPSGGVVGMPGYATLPIGSKVTTKFTPIIEIAFGDSQFNYQVAVEEGAIYRIDYMENATLCNIIGKISGFQTNEGYDYRGAKIEYVVLKIDCSSEFGADIRLVDSRNIRYIKNVEELVSSTALPMVYVGTTEPDGNDYSGWYNPMTNEFKISTKDGWSKLNTKPEEEPEAGKYWWYDAENNEWIQKDIPEFNPPYKEPNTVWQFDPSVEKWILQPIAEKPVFNTDIDDLPVTLKDRFIPNRPLTAIGKNQEHYYNLNFKEWDVRDKKPESMEYAYFNHVSKQWCELTKEEWLNDHNVESSGETMSNEDIESMIDTNRYFVFEYGEDLKYHIMLKIPTYDEYENKWILDIDKSIRVPELPEPKQGYSWFYNYYYNTWGQYLTPVKTDPMIIDNIIRDDIGYSYYLGDFTRKPAIAVYGAKIRLVDLTSPL